MEEVTKPIEVDEAVRRRVYEQIEHTLTVFNDVIFPELVQAFNYKQKAMYRLVSMKLIPVPIADSSDEMKLDWVAFGTATAKDKLLSSTVVRTDDHNTVQKAVQDLMVTTMRYGLKHIYIDGIEITEDAYL